MFGQLVVNGLMTGVIYALFALGFTLIFGVMKVLNLAHAAVFMTGAFTAWYLVGIGVPLAVAALIAMVVSGLLSVAIDYVAFRSLRARGQAEFAAIVASIGADLIIVSTAQILSKTQVFRFPFDAFPVVFFDLAGVRVSLLQVVIVAVGIVLVAGLVLWLSGTRFGREIRGVASNEHASRLLGVNPAAVYFQTFFISGAMAGIAGVLVGLQFNSIHFMMGSPYMLYAFVVVIIGGLGSIKGAVIASLAIGLLRSFGVAYLDQGLVDILIFSALFVTLLVAPNGLFGGAAQHGRVGRQ